MGGGGSSKTTSSTKVELPAWAQGYAQQAMGRAYDHSKRPYEQYPGQRLAPMEQEQNQGLQMTAQRAQNNALTGAAQNQAVGTLRGDYLDLSTNPAWEPMSQRITDAYRTGTAAQTDAAFSKANAYGPDHSGWQQQVAMNQRGLGDSLAGLAGTLYNTERKNQMGALSLTPQLNASAYQDAQALTGVGDARRQFTQEGLDFGYQNWWDEQNFPGQQMQDFAGMFPAFLGNQGTTTARGPNPNQSSPLAGVVGGGLTGAGLYAALASNPLTWTNPAGWAAIAGGALAGGLMS